MKHIFLKQESLKKAFPYFIICEPNGSIVECGESLKILCPDILNNQNFLEVFQFERPKNILQFGELIDLENKMLIFREKKKQFDLMGQLIYLQREKMLLFVVNLLAKSADELVRLGLNFKHFAVQDQIFDYLMLIQSQKRAAREANDLNAKLREAHKIALHASEMKSHFLANMSHELRTPMNGVLGMASVLLETNLDEEQKEYLETIISSGEHMLSLINNILDLTKIEAGHLVLNWQTVEVKSVEKFILNKFKLEAAKKSVNIVFNISDDTPKNIITDDQRLHQILINLIGNALKFTNSGAVIVSINNANKNDDNRGLRISVQDTGIGMDAKTTKKIFAPFIQGDASTTKKYGGTGLGLSICKKLVVAMGGDIHVTSELNVGSTFTFTIFEPKNLSLSQAA